MKDEDITILIPAAGNVNSACNHTLSINEPSFLNIGSTLAIDAIKKNNQAKIVLAVKNKELDIFKLNPFNDIELIAIGETSNITDTIDKSLEFVDSEWCLINPITTIPSSYDYTIPFIEFGLEKIPKENWASIYINKDKKSLFLSKLDKSSYGLLSHPFTGRILAKTKEIKFCIERIKSYEKKDLIHLADCLFKDSLVETKYTDWLDIGHVATYPLTKISCMNSRFFNTLIYDKKRNILQKKSSNINKIKQEILFYKNIPEEIKKYFPIVFGDKITKSFASYDMEYLPKPNLSEIYLFNKIGHNAILRIINSIESFFQKLYDKNFYKRENVDWLYYKKTKSRQKSLENIIENQDFNIFNQIYINDFVVNNIKFPSLKKSYNLLLKELKNINKLTPIYIGHGDLCFNNILVDPLFGSISLIDPKAEKHHKINQYGLIDKYYDLSKLNHSIEGLYDSLVNNLFNLRFIDINNINFEIYRPLEYEIYNRYFSEIMIENRIDYEHLRLLTANLFLSMIPLHRENYLRMIGFAFIGSIYLSNRSINDFIL